MNIYFPIAGTAINALLLIGLGAGVGLLSGLFGVGGGFLITPLLMFYNIPSATAVSTATNQVIASSITGARAHLKYGSLDKKIGLILAISGCLGAFLGIELFALLKKLGQLDLIISLLYIVILTAIGTLMGVESLKAIFYHQKEKPTPHIQKDSFSHWPLQMHFPASHLKTSLLPIVAIGLITGLLSSIMGISGGFLIIPALVYLLHVPNRVVVGTSLIQIACVSIFTTIFQSVTNHSVDVVIAFLLMLGGVVGAHFGAYLGRRLKAEQLRILLSLLILMVSLRLAYQLFIKPEALFTFRFLSS